MRAVVIFMAMFSFLVVHNTAPLFYRVHVIFVPFSYGFTYTVVQTEANGIWV